MSDFSQHRYYCDHCREYLYEENLGSLAIRLNNHNSVRHPADFANWTSSSLSKSAHYFGPGGVNEVAASQLVIPEAGAWGDAQFPPIITEEDRALLKKARILW